MREMKVKREEVKKKRGAFGQKKTRSVKDEMGWKKITDL